MPTYDYLCEVSNEEFECFHSITKELEECEICANKGMEQHKPKRLISGGSGRGIVELTGQDLKNKIKEDAKKLKGEVYSDANKYANVLGETRYQKIQSDMDKRRR
jgi:hypothetical protein